MTADRRARQGVRAGTLLPLRWWRDPAFALGSSARDLYVSLLSYSADETTDGHIGARHYRMIKAGVDEPDEAEMCLVETGLLVLQPDGAAITPRWRDFNLSSQEVEARRRQTAEAGVRGGRARAKRAPRTASGQFKSGSGPDDDPGGQPSDSSGQRLDVDQTASQATNQPRPPSPVPRPPSSCIPTSGYPGIRRSLAGVCP